MMNTESQIAGTPGGRSIRRAPVVLALAILLVLIGWAMPVRLFGAELKREVLVKGLERPVWVGQAPGDDDRLFIVEQHSGKIKIYRNSTGSLNADPFITIGPLATGNEQGLLGLAFDPDYATNGYFYVKRTSPRGGGDDEIFERYQSGIVAKPQPQPNPSELAQGPDRADPATRLQLLFVPGSASNHNCGWLAFGPDGFLYLGMGDAGGGYDHHGNPGNGQNRAAFFGKMLRVDIHVQPLPIAGLAWQNNTLTVTTAREHGLVSGQSVQISGTGHENVDVVKNQITVTGAKTFTVPQFNDPGAFADGGRGGVVQAGYRIPPTNPYAPATWRDDPQRTAEERTYRPELFAFGLRNPWRCSFDRATGDLWLGDVGQDIREEVDLLPFGATKEGAPFNFGWRPREGTIPTKGWENETPVTVATEPVYDYPRQFGNCMIGGYVYRGAAIPAVAGRYFFGDNGSSRVWSFKYVGGKMTDLQELTAELNAGNPPMAQLSSFGEDNRGELYVVELVGRVSRVVPATPRFRVATGALLPEWTAGQAGYRVTLAAADASAVRGADVGQNKAVTWSVVAGALPAGLTLSADGVITGTPEANSAGTAHFSVQARTAAAVQAAAALAAQVTQTASAGAAVAAPEIAALEATIAAGTATRAMTLTINEPLRIFLDEAAGALPAGAVGSAWAIVPNLSGGTAGYRWMVSKGALPAGLVLSENGAVQGTPTAVSAVAFTLAVTDAAGARAEQAISFQIGAAGSLNTAAGAHPLVAPYGLFARLAVRPYLGLPVSEEQPMPGKLSETGLYADLRNRWPAPEWIPYGLNQEAWNDGLTAERWIAVPTGRAIGFAADGHWQFPAGTVLLQQLYVTPAAAERQPIETRVLVVKADESVYAAAYRWRTDQSDADLVTTPEEVAIPKAKSATGKQPYLFMSSANCMTCHTAAGGYVLGVNALQLNGNFAYPPGRGEGRGAQVDNQLRAWNHAGLFTQRQSEAALLKLPKLAAITDTKSPLELRVKSYWAANCVQCHQPGGAATAASDLRFNVALVDRHLLNEPLKGNNFGLPNMLVITPGSHEKSMQWQRVQSTSPAMMMPPLGRHVEDQAGAALLKEWIDSLPASGTK